MGKLTSLWVLGFVRQMRDINASLSCLKDCVRALRGRALAAAAASAQEGTTPGERESVPAQMQPSSPPAQHVPYRRSKLTMLLKECFATTCDAGADASYGSGSKAPTTPPPRTVVLAHVAPLSDSVEYVCYHRASLPAHAYPSSSSPCRLCALRSPTYAHTTRVYTSGHAASDLPSLPLPGSSAI